MYPIHAADPLLEPMLLRQPPLGVLGFVSAAGFGAMPIKEPPHALVADLRLGWFWRERSCAGLLRGGGK